MRTQGKPGLWLGLWSGLFLTLPLVAIFYLGYRLAALPFPPFNLLASLAEAALCKTGTYQEVRIQEIKCLADVSTG
jgi:hypothetical protein